MLFDTHTHINVADFKEDQVAVIENARSVGVKRMAVVGFDYPTIKESLRLSSQYDEIVSIIGWHPTEAKSYTAETETFLLNLLDNEQVVALGETGLDYYWEDSPHDVQDKVFRRQIAIAKEFNLPVVIHQRDSVEAVYKVLKEVAIQDVVGIMHSFGENSEWAKRFLDLGMHISFSGVATFKKTEEVRQAAKIIPSDKILIETDAPYLAPVPKRGKRNEPAFVKYVAEVLSAVREQSYEEFAQMTYQNAINLFNMKEEIDETKN